MSLPTATTTIAVRRTATSETHDAATDTPLPLEEVVAGVRAHITGPGGREDPLAAAEGRMTVDAQLRCDPFDGTLTHRDQVTDTVTGLTYEVTWVAYRAGVGLDHWEAGLRLLGGVP